MFSDLVRCRYFQRAFGWCVPIGALGGLVGLGGGEFRLPVLMYAVGFGAKSAIPLNLMVSLVTLTFSLLVRGISVPVASIAPYPAEISGLAAGGVLSAFFGARLVQNLKNTHLIRSIAILLAGIGLLMLVEVIHPFAYVAVVGPLPAVHFAVGFAIGLGVGLVSSMLGVAGGELLIPALMFVFGLGIKTAGSASALISLLVILSGLWRYWRMGTIPSGRGIQRITGAMAAGSILGALLGGLALAYAPVDAVKFLLASVLLTTAAKTFLHKAQDATLEAGGSLPIARAREQRRA